MYKKTKRAKTVRNFCADGTLTKSILLTSLPIAGQNLISFSSSFIDSLMVAPLGAEAVGGVYAGSEIQRLLRYFLIGAEAAVLIAGSVAIGKKNRREAVKIGVWGILIASAVAVLAALVSFFFSEKILSLFSTEAKIREAGALYLKISALSFPVFCLSESLVCADRCLGGKGAGPVSSGVALAVGLVLDIGLIGGRLGLPALGVKGAALSSVVARGAQLLSVFIFFLVRALARRARKGSPAPNEDKPQGEKPSLLPFSSLRMLLRAAIPTVSAQLVWGFYMMLSAAIMTSLPSGAASAGVASAAYNLAMAPTAGYTAALSMLSGRAKGEGNRERLYRLRATAERLSPAIGLITSLATAAIARPLVCLYSGGRESLSSALPLLLVLILTLPLSTYESPALYGLLRGAGEAPFVLKTDLIVLFGVVLPSAFLAKDLGVSAPLLYFILRSEAIIKAAVAALRLRSSIRPVDSGG